MLQALTNKQFHMKLKARMQRSHNALMTYHKRIVKEHKELLHDLKHVMDESKKKD